MQPTPDGRRSSAFAAHIIGPAWLTSRVRPDNMPFVNVTKNRAEEGTRYPCPCCGCRTLAERGGDELCQVCFWEDDGQDDHDADEVRGGPNSDLSLTQARRNYREFGAYERSALIHVRKPKSEEM